MATPAESLLEEAPRLPAADRALMAADLLASLDDEGADEAAVDESRSKETDRRARLLDAGEAELGTWDDRVDRVDSRRHSRSAG